jgi:hypothetical protein
MIGYYRLNFNDNLSLIHDPENDKPEEYESYCPGQGSINC